jgi:hypothetical protein
MARRSNPWEAYRAQFADSFFSRYRAGQNLLRDPRHGSTRTVLFAAGCARFNSRASKLVQEGKGFLFLRTVYYSGRRPTGFRAGTEYLDHA